MNKSAAASPESAASRQPAGQYVVVARRYRPQTFAELVGQQHIAQALTGAITNNRVGHAYLFTGARGVGKTSAARILAKALDCEHGPTPTPCNQCDICQSISAGEDVDVLEIDGASNRGIDEIRDLRQKVNVRPSRARYKIYIIDEVHMLTREAFNALLKTLEEPPEHVKFIFCTTEAEKIPITILSRCQRFDFAGIQTPSIVDRLRQIALAEGVEADADALQIIARRAAGSMRDSQSLLEQLLALGEARITAADVHRLLGTASAARLGPLVEHLGQRDAASALAELDAALGEGVDVGQLLEQLLGYYRDLMVAAVGASDESFLNVSAGEQAAVRARARELGVATILASMQILDQTLARLRYSVHGRTLAELAVVRLSQLENLDDLATLMAQAREGLPPAAAGASSPPARAVPKPASSLAGEAKKKDDAVPDTAAAPAESVKTICPPVSGTRLTAENLPAIWSQVLERLPILTREQLATAAGTAILGPNRLVVTLREKYTLTFCERPEPLQKLEKALLEVVGEPVRIEFALLETPSDDRAAADLKTRAPTAQERMRQASQHPLVQRAVELFDARPVRVENSNEG